MYTGAKVRSCNITPTRQLLPLELRGREGFEKGAMAAMEVGESSWSEVAGMRLRGGLFIGQLW